MKAAPWRVRAARKQDRARLRTFHCADSAIEWEREVEQFVQLGLYDWAFDPFAKANDPRLLLLLHGAHDELIGVAAHERTQLAYANSKPFAATQLEVLAVARDWQGRRFPTGERVSDVLMSSVLSDVRNRVPPRAARIFATVHERNARSISLLKRHGLSDELSREHPLYRRLVTPHLP